MYVYLIFYIKWHWMRLVLSYTPSTNQYSNNELIIIKIKSQLWDSGISRSNNSLKKWNYKSAQTNFQGLTTKFTVQSSFSWLLKQTGQPLFLFLIKVELVRCLRIYLTCQLTYEEVLLWSTNSEDTPPQSPVSSGRTWTGSWANAAQPVWAMGTAVSSCCRVVASGWR